MAETIKDFLVSIGFAADESARAKAEAAVKQTEASITKTTSDEAAKRGQIDEKASTERVSLAGMIGRLLIGEEQKLSEARDKTRKSEGEKDEKRQQEAEKKSKERRENSLKSMQAVALKMAAFATKAIVAVEAASLGVVYATDRAAKSAEALFYSSQRIGASAKGISAIEYAVSQLGGSVEAAHASLEAFGDRMRSRPEGTVSYLSSIGVQTKDAQGNILKTDELYRNFLSTLSKKPVREAMIEAGAMGTDESTRMAAARPGFGARVTEAERIYGNVGADPDAAAKGGTAFEQSMRRLETVVDAIRTKIDTGLFTSLQPQLDKLAKWAEEHGDKIANIIGRIAEDLIKLAGAILERLARVDWDDLLTKVETFAKDFDALATKFFGPNGSLIATFTAFGLLLTSSVVGPLSAILGTMRLLNAMALPPWLTALLAYTAAGTAASVATAKAIQNANPAANDLFIDPSTGLGINTAPGSGNQFTGGLGDTSNSVLGRAWNWTKSKLGFGGGDAGTGGRTVVDQSIPVEGRALLDTLASGEAKDYNILNGGGTFSSYADHPDAGGHRAAGRYQFLPSTWKGIQKETGLGDFSPANQDKGAWYLARRDYRLRTGRDLQSDLASKDPARIAAIGQALSPTWVSLNGSFSGKYSRFLGRDGTPTTSAPSGTVGDAAYMAAQQRRGAGQSQPGDADLMARYHQQQAAPAHTATSLAHPQSHPVQVELTEKNTTAVGRKFGHAMIDARIRGAVQGRQASWSATANLSPEQLALRKAMLHPDSSRLPTLHSPLGITPQVQSSINNSRNRGDLNVAHTQNFTINGGTDPRQMMAEAKRSAGRGNADLLRNLQSMEV